MASQPSPSAAADTVRIERRGGLAGLHVCSEHAYSTLTALQRRALDGLLSAAAGDAPPAGADRLSYRIQVRQPGGDERLVMVSEDAMPSSLAALVKPTLPG